MFSFKSVAAVVVAAVISARAETHTVTFNNRCGKGTPMLIQGSKVLSTGQPFTTGAPLRSVIAYLQTGPCLFNGEGCTTIETTLVNPTTPGSGSSSDITLIPPHAFNVAAGFNYNNGCSGSADYELLDKTINAILTLPLLGTDPNCPTAFHNPNDTHVQVPWDFTS